MTGPGVKAGSRDPAIGEQVSISLTPQDADLFWAVIEGEGFEKSGQGVKDYVLAALDEPDEPGAARLARTIFNAVKENPAIVDALKRRGADLILRALRSVRGA